MTASGVEDLDGQRLAVLGLGLENRALARFLGDHGLRFTACDASPPVGFESLRAELDAAVEAWRLGSDYLQGLEEFEVVFRTPGISALRPELLQACQQGVRLHSQTRLFAALCPALLIGVTGTKGKGTTASLLTAILARDAGHRAWLAGNIGMPPISFLHELTPQDRVVLELSSFQLMDWDRSPQVALV
ncbi:MAG: UDP-N-acetylmuramoyl-L-alanine--D-glutamate ligase, partial [Candidatus Latescibacterota bacterium]